MEEDTGLTLVHCPYGAVVPIAEHLCNKCPEITKDSLQCPCGSKKDLSNSFSWIGDNNFYCILCRQIKNKEINFIIDETEKRCGSVSDALYEIIKKRKS